MKWYTDKWHKRMLTSLNESIYEAYKVQIDDIRKLSELIHRKAMTRRLEGIQASTLIRENELARFLADLHDRDRNADEMRQEGYFEKLRIVVQNEFRDTMERNMGNIQQGIADRLLANVSRQIAGETALRYLEQKAQDLTPIMRLSTQSTGAETTAGLDVGPIGTAAICAPPALPHHTSKDKIQLASACLESFYDRHNISPHFETPDALFLTNPSVAARIQAFTLSSTSEVLHVCGPMEQCEETHSALLATRFASSVRDSKVPTLSYFCQLSRAPVPEWRTRETVELARLAYALIRQLVEVLPDGKEFDEERLGDAAFKALDGTLATWGEAMEVLRCLLQEVVEHQPLLYIVIDGISLLDDVSRHSTDRPLGELVGLLCGRVEGQGGHLVKLLFTTAGESRALNAELEGNCTVKASI
ncbi:hypothetical protein BFW01_g874 [Lasiodiplodia theobromae]|uniref:Uncharacterized protein n=1 Tax=Lasiodiplodia theobromae TaxID=45133 RepID=A0A8H7IR83_9PEZI|nr:hypothetical protein BFW01_g874 [Lasiodiplodia theobromae]